MFKQFETVDSALKEFQDDFTINALYYDDLKRLIVVEEPKHSNKMLLVERGQDIDYNLAKSITKDLAKHHKDQYAEVFIQQAEENPIPYNELFQYLHENLRIFYDAAKELEQWILRSPREFGLDKMMHHKNSLCFIPKRG